MKVKTLFVFSSLLCLQFVSVFADYGHSYGKGHGGGHGIYGYPVGRKWGYSTYIKHPPPKHHGGYGHSYGGDRGYSSSGYGGQGFGNEGFGFGSPGYGFGHWPTRQSYGQNYGHAFAGYPAHSHTYRRQYIPFNSYGFDRNRREDTPSGHDSGAYNSYGQHKNHNYGAHSKTYNTGSVRPKTEEDFAPFDSLLGKDFTNYLVDLNLPDNFEQLIY